MNKKIRKNIASFSFLVTIALTIASVLVAALSLLSITSCLVNCEDPWKWKNTNETLFTLMLISFGVSLSNLIYQFFIHKWKGLLVWEKFTFYLFIVTLLLLIFL